LKDTGKKAAKPVRGNAPSLILSPPLFPSPLAGEGLAKQEGEGYAIVEQIFHAFVVGLKEVIREKKRRYFHISHNRRKP
jgi:hypothetical protein